MKYFTGKQYLSTLSLAAVLLLPTFVSAAETANTRFTERAEQAKAKLENRQAMMEERKIARDERQTERTEARQDAFCSRFTDRLDAKSERMTDREGKVKGRVETRMSRQTERRDARDEKFESTRTEQDTRRAELYVKLEAKADTDAERAAVVEFKKTMDAAISLRRTTVNKIIDDFRASVDALINTRKNSATDNYGKFKVAVEAAEAKAKSDCEAGTDPKTVMANYQSAMKAAREALKADKNTTQKISSEIRALAETKKQAMEAAMTEFKKTAEAARTKLKAVFKEPASTKTNTPETEPVEAE